MKIRIILATIVISFGVCTVAYGQPITIPPEAVVFKLNFDSSPYSLGNTFTNLSAGNNAASMQQPSPLPTYYEGHRTNPCDAVGGALVIGSDGGNNYMESRLVNGAAGPQVNTYAVRNTMEEYDSFISFRYKSISTTEAQLKLNRVYVMHCFDGNGIIRDRALTLNFAGKTSSLNGLVTEFVYEGANGKTPQNLIIPVTEAQFREWHTYGIRIYRSADNYVMYDGYFDGEYVSTVKSSLTWVGNQMTFAALRAWGGPTGAGGACIDDFTVCKSTDFLPATGGPVIPPPIPAPDNIPVDAPFTVISATSFVSENFDTMTSVGLRPSYWLPYFGISSEVGVNSIVSNPSGTGKVLKMDVTGVGNSSKKSGPNLDIENNAQMSTIEDSDVFISYKLYTTKDAVFQTEVALGGQYNKKDTSTIGATEDGYSRYKFGTYTGYLVQGKNLQYVARPTTDYERWHTFGIHIYRIPDVQLGNDLVDKSAIMDYYFDGVRYSSKRIYLSRFVGELEKLKFMGFKTMPFYMSSTGVTEYCIYMDDLRVDYVETDPSIYPEPPVERVVPTPPPPPIVVVNASVLAAAYDGQYKTLDNTNSNVMDFSRELRAAADISMPFGNVFVFITQGDKIIDLRQEQADANGHIEFTVPGRVGRNGPYTMTVGGNGGVLGETFDLMTGATVSIDTFDIEAEKVYVETLINQNLSENPVVVLTATKGNVMTGVWLRNLPTMVGNNRVEFSGIKVDDCQLKAFILKSVNKLEPICDTATVTVE
jgi:hypothetical protein